MSLSNIVKRASKLFNRSGDGDGNVLNFQEGDVVFCKNNVCTHPASSIGKNDMTHHPGYLTISCLRKNSDSGNDLTLILTWLPNSSLRNDSEYVDNESHQMRRNEPSEDKVELPNLDSCDNTSERAFSVDSYDSFCSGCLIHEPSTDSGTSSNSPEFTVIEYPSIAINTKNSPNRSFSEESVDDKIQNTEYFSGNFSRAEITSEDLESFVIERENTYHNVMCSSMLDGIDHIDNDSSPFLKTGKYNTSSSNDTSRSNNSKNEQSVDDTDSFLNSNYDASHIRNLDIYDCDVNDDSFGNSKMLSIRSSNNSYLINKEDASTHIKNRCVLLVYKSPDHRIHRHDLSFQDHAISPFKIKSKPKSCRKFCVDLSEMRSLRLFFNSSDNTSGQLVIASRESQYKVLHFHHGGLEKLSDILNHWNVLISTPITTTTSDGIFPYKQFSVCQPKINDSELHPEEGHVVGIAQRVWKRMLNSVGQIEDDLVLRKAVFFGGLDKSLRSTVWPFLLHCYSYHSTYEERIYIQEVRKCEYLDIINRRISLTGDIREAFEKNVECVVEKDVIRTDRSNPFYAGENNPHLETMKNILLNYAIYNSKHGYTQGMSDLLAPILAEISNECDAFWCFVGVMRRGLFICTPTDSDMERNLSYLRELIRLIYPPFYNYLKRHPDGMDLLFCHRWLLLCFKREFPEEITLQMWEACWSNYLTDYFHLFLCLAIIIIYSEDIIKQDLRTDEALFHFSSLAMYMDGTMVLRKARGLLHSFRLLRKVPCTLATLCEQCGPGIWDSSHVPVVECVGVPHCLDFPCPYTKK